MCECADLKGVDPDDAFSSVPYEKGFNFLWYLQSLVGEERFSAFLKAYVVKFSFKCLTSYDFKAFFLEQFADVADKVACVDWDTWLHVAGYPPVENKFDTTLVEAARGLANAYIEGRGDTEGKALGKDLWQWRSQQIVIFLETVTAALRLDPSQASSYRALCALINANHDVASTRNSEIRFRWLMLGIACEYEEGTCDTHTHRLYFLYLSRPAVSYIISSPSTCACAYVVYPDAMKMATEQGRMKFVRPLYRSLFGTSSGKELAVSTFNANKQVYNLVCAKMVAKDLQLA